MMIELKKITRIEVDSGRKEIFINGEFTDENGFLNFGKWYRGEDYDVDMDEEKAGLLLQRDQGEVILRRAKEAEAQESAQVEADLIQREQAVMAKEADLIQREQAVMVKEADLIQRGQAVKNL